MKNYDDKTKGKIKNRNYRKIRKYLIVGFKEYNI